MNKQTSILDSTASSSNQNYTRQFPNSTSVESVTYYPVYNHLEVKFTNKRNYKYEGVAWDVAQAILNVADNTSVGKLINNLIVRGGYRYQEIK